MLFIKQYRRFGEALEGCWSSLDYLKALPENVIFPLDAPSFGNASTCYRSICTNQNEFLS